MKNNKKLSKTALHTWREAKKVTTRKYKDFLECFYFKPRYLHNKKMICDYILTDPSIKNNL